MDTEKLKIHGYAGWGIRYFGEGFLYNVNGLKAIELFLENGKKLRIGTDEPEKLGDALKEGSIDNKES